MKINIDKQEGPRFTRNFEAGRLYYMHVKSGTGPMPSNCIYLCCRSLNPPALRLFSLSSGFIFSQVSTGGDDLVADWEDVTEHYYVTGPTSRGVPLAKPGADALSGTWQF